MTSKLVQGTESPPHSSLSFPILRHSRRGSLASLSAASQIDKDTLAQALDHIHLTASQTETLTTFNEYTSPPSSSSGPEGKGIASELQGGLSGLYSRFRASVGGVRDIVGGGVLVGEDTSIESLPIKAPGAFSPTPTPSTKPSFSSVKFSNPSAPTLDSDHQVHFPSDSIPGETHPPSRDQVRSTKTLKAISGSTGPSTKISLASNSSLKPPLGPLTQANTPTGVGPALAEVNISAAREYDSRSDAMSGGNNIGFAVGSFSSGGTRTDDPQTVDRLRLANVGSEYLGNRGPVDSSTHEGKISSVHSSRASTPIVPRSASSFIRNHDSNSIKDLPSSYMNRPPANEDSAIRDPDAVTIDETAHHLQRRSSTIQVPAEGLGSTVAPSTSQKEYLQEGSIEGTKKDQHAEHNPSKSLASPNVRQSCPPDVSLSRASSSDNAESSNIGTPTYSQSNEDLIVFDGSRGQKSSQIRASEAIVQDTDPRTMSVVLSQIRSKVLSKEFWMRDENARDCFYCGDTFSTFRRKHHCRLCGQIFDAKCMSLVSGTQFGQSGSLRVCKQCEGIINGYDDSSEFSDDANFPTPVLRPRHGSRGGSDIIPVSPFPKAGPATGHEPHRPPKQPDLAVPTMAIPATRRVGDESSRRPAVLEIDAEHTLARPSSSRSLKASFGIRPHPSSHKRHYSRFQHQRSFKPVSEDSAPFHRNPADERGEESRLPVFHDDNIIDPDLAPFLSDEGSSGDEQVSIMTAMNGDGMSRSLENDRNGLSGLLASSKKGRSRVGDKSINGMASRDPDNASLTSSRMMNVPRNPKRRNLSVSSNVHLRPSPRAYRGSTALPTFGLNLHESMSSSALAQMSSSSNPVSGSRMIRSSSMKGADAPALELNNASLQHVRKLLHQLLKDANLPSIASWEKALIPILLQATDDVNPNVQNGDDIDIRHYVKIKKISGGRPGDTSYVSGLVFTKNLALKSMSRSISHPNILILNFALEYTRHQQHFMSLEPVIRQEREFLQNLVNRIAALRPQLLLVQRNVAGLALNFLEQANIATACNVKASVLEAVSRCTQTRIISSIDKLAIKPAQAGKCANFHLKTYVHGGRKKTYMHLLGCPKELGCTIVLRGAKNETLAKVKQIMEFMVYVVYNLKLETCLMRDEFALIPSSPRARPQSGLKMSEEKTPDARITIPKPATTIDAPVKTSESILDDKTSSNQDSAQLPDGRVLDGEKPILSQLEQIDTGVANNSEQQEDIPVASFYGDMVEEHSTKILSASPFVRFTQPYLLMRAREQERRLLHLKRLRDLDILEEQDVSDTPKPQKFDLIKPEMVHETVRGASKKVREVLHAVHDAEYDKALHIYQTQKKQWEAYIASNINLFDPYAHQNIAVLYSVVCTVTTVPCSGPDLLALAFYNEHETDENFEADCTLGQYVEDLCLGANTVCTANGCERKMFDHHRQYVHGEAQLSVFVQHYPCKLRGLQETILMWSCCRICGKETQVMPMSESTWKYSFGKYLELSFWSSDLYARADVCPHDLHRNHLRYFGFKDVALRVHYDVISLLEIIVPRTRITWEVDNDLRFKNDLFTKTEERLNRFMLSVKARIRSIKVESVIPEKTEPCKAEIDKLMKRANDEHHALNRNLQDKYMNSKYYEIIPLNRVVRATQEKVADWDNAFADFDRNFFPSEKDIRRLATLQLKKIFLDRDDSVSSLSSTDEGTSASLSDEDLTAKTSPDDTPVLTPQTRTLSPEKTHDMLTSVVQENTTTDSSLENKLPDHHRSAPPTSIPATNPETMQASQPHSEKEDVRHLDLANFSEGMSDGSRPFLLNPHSNKPDAKTEPLRADHQFEKASHATPSIVEPNSDTEAGVTGAALSRDFAAPTPIRSSGIPRPQELNLRQVGLIVSPTLNRAHSQPSHVQADRTANSSNQPTSQNADLGTSTKSLDEPLNAVLSDSAARNGEKKLSDRLGLNTLKAGGVSAHSMIPRSIATRRKESRVFTLAKHFEQLSREFEKERLRERRQRAAKSRQARAYPMAISKPIVEIYRNVHEAVEEREPSDEELLAPEPSHENHEETPATIDHMAQNTTSQTQGEGFHAENTTAETTETDDNPRFESPVGSDVEAEGDRSDEDHSLLDDIPSTGVTEEHTENSPAESPMDLKLDLPKHEKSSLIKLLTNFWAERSASGWQALEYPLNASDHIFADSDVIVREDEPSSLIAFALGSEDYKAKLRSIYEKNKGLQGQLEKTACPDPLLTPEEQIEVERSLLRSTGTHLKYQFQEGSAKMLCKIFYAEQFEAVRRKCGVTERIVESLSRCLKWDSKGGKTKSVFLKTLDDRLVLKSLSQIETQAFLRFAPAYFQIMSEALFHELPSVIAKMLGFYQIIIKNPVTGVEFNWFLLVMENLFYDRSPTRIFDLKGSMRNRRIQSTGEQNEVLLDENMVEFIYESPLFSREHSKKLLRASVWNDTLFLARQNVMDYSLMIAIDEDRKELVVGIIDCIRTYTWDKKLESWIKDRGKNRPTVTSPRDYKSRFREAMGRYVLQAPNCWHQFQAQQMEKRHFRIDERLQGQEGGTDGEVAVGI